MKPGNNGLYNILWQNKRLASIDSGYYSVTRAELAIKEEYPSAWAVELENEVRVYETHTAYLSNLEPIAIIAPM
jgi:hypothetical protein